MIRTANTDGAGDTGPPPTRPRFVEPDCVVNTTGARAGSSQLGHEVEEVLCVMPSEPEPEPRSSMLDGLENPNGQEALAETALVAAEHRQITRSYGSRRDLAANEDTTMMPAEQFHNELFIAGFDADDSSWMVQLARICKARGQPENWLVSEEISQGVARTFAEQYGMYAEIGLVVCTVGRADVAMPVGQIFLVYRVDIKGHRAYGQRVKNVVKPLQAISGEPEWFSRNDVEPWAYAYEGLLCRSSRVRTAAECSIRRQSFVGKKRSSSRFSSRRSRRASDEYWVVEASCRRRAFATRARVPELQFINLTNGEGWSPLVGTRVIRAPVSKQWRLIYDGMPWSL